MDPTENSWHLHNISVQIELNLYRSYAEHCGDSKEKEILGHSFQQKIRELPRPWYKCRTDLNQENLAALP